MHKIFKEVKGVLYFQDTILIHAKDQEEHDKFLHTVLERLKENSLTVQRDKCKFNQTAVDYLGHTVTPDGIKPKESLVTAVVDAPAPQNKEQLRSFLGLCEYMSKFMKNFAGKAAPLCAMMKDKVNFVWDETHQKVFDGIKSEIAKRPTFSAFDSSLNVETILTTDASQYGLGAVLSQVSNGIEQPIIFVSCTLSNAEKNYSVIEKETLVVHWATQRLRTFLWGRRFTMRTDHKSLTSILTTKGFASDRTSQRINKWPTLLLEYNFDIQYIPGVNNTVADCMSRLPLQSLKEDFTDDDICIAEVSEITNGAISTQEDSTLQKAISYMHSQWPVRKSLQGDMQRLYDINNELSVRNGLLYRSDQLVVPESLQPTILQHAHEGHFGMALVKRRLRQHYWWPGLDKQVEHLVRDCHVCASSDKPYRTYQAPMTSTPPPEGPWQKVAMDIMGPFKTMTGKYAIVLIDYFSKWCEVEFVTDITTSRAIKFLQSVFVHEGYPIHIVMDNGVQFTSHEIKDYFTERGIEHSTTPLYHPQGNGLVERMNRTIKEGIQLATLQHKDPVQATKERLFVYHTAPHSMTEKTPFELMRGRVAKTKLYTFGSKVSSKFQNIQTSQVQGISQPKTRCKSPRYKTG